MTQSSTELEHEVEEQRMRVEEKLTSLRERMSVGQLFDEAGRYVHADDFSQAARTMGRQVRDNPLALGLVGVGLGWLMLSNGSSHHASQPSRSQYSLPPYDDDDLDEHDTTYATSSKKGKRTMASKIKSAARSTGETLHSAMESGRRGMHDLRDGIVEKGKAAASYASSSSSSGSESGHYGSRSGRSSHGGTRRQIAGQFDSGRRALSRAMDNEPLLMGAMAVAVGVLIGAALPSTRQEDRLLGETRDDLWDEAKRSGRDLADKARHVAEETAIAAKDAATETAKKSAKKEGLTGSGSQSGSSASGSGSSGSGSGTASGSGATTGGSGSGSATGATGSKSPGTTGGTGSLGGSTGSTGTGSTSTAGTGSTPSPASGSGINPTRP